MKLNEIFAPPRFIENPFPTSLVKDVLYHGTKTKFDSFLRPVHGIYVTPSERWAKTHYGDKIVALYANITKIHTATYEEGDCFYNMDYPAVAKFLTELSSQGFNACHFGGESDSMVLFNDVQIVNAVTGKSM